MQRPIVLELYDGTGGFVVVGHDEAAFVAEHCFSDGRVPFMGTNARHPKHTPMVFVGTEDLARVVRILTNLGHYVTFKGQRQTKGDRQ